MKVVLLTLCFALGVLAQDKYESANDDFNVKEVLTNERLLNSYAKCLLSKGPCTPEVKQVKDKLPEALETRCAKCTDKQKQMGKVLAQEVKKNHPDIWKQLVAKYDPEGKYQQFTMKADCVLLATLMAVVAADFYDSKYDSFDVQPLLENDRILLSYSKCFLDQGPCTPDAKDFKKVIPEALETTCGKCSPKQKQLIKTVIKALIARHPETWEQLSEKYDKDKKFKESFDKFLAEED